MNRKIFVLGLIILSGFMAGCSQSTDTTTTTTASTTTSTTAIATTTTTTTTASTTTSTTAIATTTSTSTTTTTTSTTVPIAGTEYYPNTDGYSWTFIITSTGTTAAQNYSGAERFTFNGTTTEASILLQIKKDEYFAVSGPQSTSTREGVETVTTTEVMSYGTKGAHTTPAMKMLAFPFTVGTTWEFVPGATFEVAAYEPVVADAGTFNCLKINYPLPPPYTVRYWYARNVGLVKYQATSGVANQTTQVVTWELSSKNF